MLLSAIRGLEDAVYYKDCRGRYASLPDNNSMRIDLISSRIEELAKMIEDSMGGDIPGNINSITYRKAKEKRAVSWPSRFQSS
jgi:hypothetical protein